MHRTLSKYFGYDEFRPLQEDIVNDVLAGNDVFVLMPTGGGKSLCYQLPAILMDGLTVVVSPLISLMKDQVDTLKANGIEAAYINSTLSYREKVNIKQDLERNLIKLLYVAPERLVLSDTLSLFDRIKVNLFAIDESHCISAWGHDFRPEYRKLSILKNKYPKIPIIALTATATPKVMQDTVSQLNIPDCKVYIASFNRKNLFYQVRPKKDTYDQIVKFLNVRKDKSGIIYCQSRKTVDDITFKLKKDGFNALPYHAGLSDVIRARNQETFLKDDVEIIVATIAFGMGIDKPNVRFVIHYDLPRNLESYYQETGRGGRDGLECECLLFFSRGDKYKIDYFIDQISLKEERESARSKLQDVFNYCQSTVCRRKTLLKYFGENLQVDNCGGCDVCLQPQKKTDITEETKLLIECVKELGGSYGITHVCEILTGSSSKKVTSKGHHRLKSYATGTYLKKDRWSAIARELVQQKILQLEGLRYPILKLGISSKDVLENKKTVDFIEISNDIDVHKSPIFELINKISVDNSFEKEIQKQSNASHINFDLKLNKLDTKLFNQLKVLRKQISIREKVPPYVVFADTSLKQMATQLPLDEQELLKITGVGEYKLQKYGEVFLEEIRSYLDHTNNNNLEIAQQSSVIIDNKEKILQCIVSLRQEFINLTIQKLGKKYSEKTIEELWDEILSAKY